MGEDDTMPFWRQHTPLEQAFWQDDTTRNVLLTIDRWFWAICLVNVLSQPFWFPRLLDSVVYLTVQALSWCYLIVAVAVAIAITRDEVRYYRHRGKVMFFNRSVRILAYALLGHYVDEQAMVKLYVTDKIAAGRHPLLVVFLILSQVTGNNLLWTLYFPLPFGHGIWLDIVQQGLRILMSGMRSARLLGEPVLRPTVTSMCEVLNASLIGLPLVSVPMQPFDVCCAEDGPLLLSLYSWWFFGSFWPSFITWYCEYVMRENFERRRREADGEQLGREADRDEWDLRASTRSCIWMFSMASVSWLLLHGLLGSESTRTLVVRALLFMHPGQEPVAIQRHVVGPYNVMSMTCSG